MSFPVRLDRQFIKTNRSYKPSWTLDDHVLDTTPPTPLDLSAAGVDVELRLTSQTDGTLVAILSTANAGETSFDNPTVGSPDDGSDGYVQFLGSTAWTAVIPVGMYDVEVRYIATGDTPGTDFCVASGVAQVDAALA